VLTAVSKTLQTGLWYLSLRRVDIVRCILRKHLLATARCYCHSKCLWFKKIFLNNDNEQLSKQTNKQTNLATAKETVMWATHVFNPPDDSVLPSRGYVDKLCTITQSRNGPEHHQNLFSFLDFIPTLLLSNHAYRYGMFLSKLTL
jgi:hypothetical protein